MKYYYLIDAADITKNYAVCFGSKKKMVEYANQNCLIWFYVVNKKYLPERITNIIGNGICKDYRTKDNVLVIKDSLKDRRK